MGTSTAPECRGTRTVRADGARRFAGRVLAAVAFAGLPFFGGLGWISPGVLHGAAPVPGPLEGEEEATSALAPVLESWSINGHRVRVALIVPAVLRDDSGEPVDRIDVNVESGSGDSFEAVDEGSWSAWEELRVDDLFELVIEVKEPVVGRIRLVQVGPDGSPAGDPLDLPIGFRDVGVRVYEETVGPAPSVLEVVPGFRRPLVLAVEDRYGRFRNDVSGTYRLSVEGPGADAFRVGVVEYAEQMSLDLQTFWSLGGASGAASEAASGSESNADGAAEADSGAGAGEAGTGDDGLVVEIRDGVARVWIEALPGAEGAVLVGTPRVESSPLSEMRLRVEPGVSRADGSEGLVLERMTKYATHWRFWLRVAEPVADPWRTPGGSLLATAEVLDGEDWLGIEPPFASIDWVRCDDEGRCWTFTGEKRDFDDATRMRMIFEFRDGSGESKGRFDIDVN